MKIWHILFSLCFGSHFATNAAMLVEGNGGFNESECGYWRTCSAEEIARGAERLRAEADQLQLAGADFRTIFAKIDRAIQLPGLSKNGVNKIYTERESAKLHYHALLGTKKAEKRYFDGEDLQNFTYDKETVEEYYDGKLPYFMKEEIITAIRELQPAEILVNQNGTETPYPLIVFSLVSGLDIHFLAVTAHHAQILLSNLDAVSDNQLNMVNNQPHKLIYYNLDIFLFTLIIPDALKE